MSAPSKVQRVAFHEHLCPLHGWYACGLETARCPLRLKTVAECPTCAKVAEIEERKKVDRGRRFWKPLQERARGV